MKGGALIREARLRSGLGQRDLAARLGTSHAAISRWETEAVRPTWDTVTKAVRECGLDLRIALVARDDEELPRLRERLGRTPEQRVDDLTAYVSFVEQARAALRASRQAR